MSSLSDIPFSWRDLIDLVLVAFIIYRIILAVRGTRAVPVIYGLLLIGLLYFLSGELGFQTLHWLLGYFLGSILLIIIILFQDDLRRTLSDMGSKSRMWLRRQTQASPKNQFVNVLSEALMHMARKKIGALVVLERSTPLGDLIEKGVPIEARATTELIISIFYPGTPLHDGAVIIRNDKILAARCVLPLSSESTPSGLGTRHRAALGLAGQSDAIVLVVSEERGVISMAIGHTLEIIPNVSRLKQAISALTELPR